MASGRPEAALPPLEQALELNGDVDAAWELAGDLYNQTGQAEASLEAYTRASEIAPLVMRYHLRLGQLCRNMGHLDQALVHLNRALELHADDDELAAVQTGIGKVFEARRQYDRAYKAYVTAIQRRPNEASHYYRAGLALKNLTDYGEALAMFRKAVALDPKYVDAHRQLAAVSALELVNGVAA